MLDSLLNIAADELNGSFTLRRSFAHDLVKATNFSSPTFPQSFTLCILHSAFLVRQLFACSLCQCSQEWANRSLLLFGYLAHELSCGVEIFVVINVKIFLFPLDHLFSDIAVSSLQTEDHRLFKLVLFVSLNN